MYAVDTFSKCVTTANCFFFSLRALRSIVTQLHAVTMLIHIETGRGRNWTLCPWVLQLKLSFNVLLAVVRYHAGPPISPTRKILKTWNLKNKVDDTHTQAFWVLCMCVCLCGCIRVRACECVRARGRVCPRVHACVFVTTLLLSCLVLLTCWKFTSFPVYYLLFIILPSFPLSSMWHTTSKQKFRTALSPPEPSRVDEKLVLVTILPPGVGEHVLSNSHTWSPAQTNSHSPTHIRIISPQRRW